MRHFILMTAAATMMLTGCTPAAAPRTMVIDDPLAEVAQRVEMLRVPEGLRQLLAMYGAKVDMAGQGPVTTWHFSQNGTPLGDYSVALADKDGTQTNVTEKFEPGTQKAALTGDQIDASGVLNTVAPLAMGEAVRAGLSQTPFDKAPIEVAAKAYMARHPDEVAALQARFKRSLMESGFR